MKTVKILVALALMAGGTANAVTVSFGTASGTTAVNLIPPGGSANPGVEGTPYASLTFNNGGDSVTVSGYYYNSGLNPAAWMTAPVRYYHSSPPAGVGVTENSTNELVQGALQEYILLDFGAGVTTISSLTLYLDNGAPSSQYFTYAWGSVPTVGTQLPAVPLTAFTGTPTPAPANPLVAGSYTFDMSATGSGRYLLLGASDHANRTPTTSSFLVQSVTYTTVPDGATTLALIGAGIGALGLATRRRWL